MCRPRRSSISSLPEFKHLMALRRARIRRRRRCDRPPAQPFKRKRDKPVAYWSGIVDVNGDKTLDYAGAGLFPRQDAGDGRRR